LNCSTNKKTHLVKKFRS